MLVEVPSANVEAAANSLGNVAQIINEHINEHDYSKQKISNVDKVALYWKMSSRTFKAREAMLIPGFKVVKDKLTFLLGVNVPGHLKLKPVLIYHSKNPRALKNGVAFTLPVLCK